VLALASGVDCAPGPLTTDHCYVDKINGSDANPETSQDKLWQTFSPVHAFDFLPGSVIQFKCGSSWTGAPESLTTDHYYVDSINGSDANLGTSQDKPWQTLTPVHATSFLPGSVVHFRRGSNWTGGLVIDESGEPGNPITFTTYGTGDRPVFTNPGELDSRTRAVKIEASWVVVEGLLVRDAHEAGVFISTGADHNIVRDIEVSNVGIGIAIWGQRNLVTRNYVHDLHMVVNTPDEKGDYGAVGIWFFNSFNEASYNRIVNCIAPSYDYGVDGGAVEWWGDADGNYVHHNWASGNAGFLEVGGGSVRDAIVAYNVSANNGRFSWIHLSGRFASDLESFRIENNTIVETTTEHWVVLGFSGDPAENTFIVRNNIFYIDRPQIVANTSSFTHNHNLYYLGDGAQLGFTLGQGEKGADPLFVNLTAHNFHLEPSSPAINAGVDLGYTLDFEDRPVPVDAAPDLGALEYQCTRGASNQ
jgi:hypothetical protein